MNPISYVMQKQLEQGGVLTAEGLAQLCAQSDERVGKILFHLRMVEWGNRLKVESILYDQVIKGNADCLALLERLFGGADFPQRPGSFGAIWKDATPEEKMAFYRLDAARSAALPRGKAHALRVAFNRIAMEDPDDYGIPRTTTTPRFIESVKQDIRSDARDGKWSSMDLARVELEMRKYLSEIEYATGDGFYRGQPFNSEDKHFIENVIGGFLKLLDQASTEAKEIFLTPFRDSLRPTNVPWKKRAKAVKDFANADYAAWQLAHPGMEIRRFPKKSVIWDEVDRFPTAAATGDAISLAKARNRKVSK